MLDFLSAEVDTFGHGQPTASAPRGARLEAGRAGRAGRRVAADGERRRDRQVRPEPAPGLQAGAALRAPDRADLPLRRRRGRPSNQVRTDMRPSETSAPTTTPGERWHARAFVIVPVLFVAAYFAARAGIENTAAGSTRALAFALLPVPFLAAFLWIYVRGVRMMDELESRIHLEALALAFPVALLVVFTAGLLD